MSTADLPRSGSETGQVARFLLRFGFEVAVIAYFAVGIATLTPGHRWGDDWAQYVLHAKNILAGHPYADTGYKFNPDIPNIGPPAYPPGLPILLAAVLSVFGMSYFAMKVACFGCIVLALPLVRSVLARPLGDRIALLSVALFALHSKVWDLRDEIVSEAPYILVTLLALWWLDRDDRLPAHPAARLSSGLLLGVLAYAAVACRSIGVTLAAAMLVHAWVSRKSIVWYAGFLGTFCLLVLAQSRFLIPPTTYGHELALPTLKSILGNLNGYRIQLGAIFHLGILSPVLSAAVVVSAIAGALPFFRFGNAGNPGPPPLRQRLASVPPFVWYLLVYVTGLVLAEIEPSERYLLPVLPFLIALAANGVAPLIERLGNPRVAYPCLAAALIAYYVALHAALPTLRPDEFATCDDCHDLYSFIRDHDPQNSVVAFRKPRAMALLSGQPSWVWSPKYSLAEFQARLIANRVGILVIAAPGTWLFPENPAPNIVRSILAVPANRIVFRNRGFTAIELGQAQPTSPL